MSNEWTPTTEIVREAFSNDPEVEYHDPLGFAGYVAENRRMFDRWLAAHDAEIRTATLGEAAVIAETNLGRRWIARETPVDLARAIRAAKVDPS